MMNERSFRFGDEAHLIGTVTPAATTMAQPPAVGLLLMNAGVVHRIGPHRINVKLARHFAARGLAALRFDLSGLGDSLRPRQPRPMGEQAMVDMRCAVDRLVAETGVSRLLLIGDCSAAEYGFQYALQDERVSALVMIDGYSYGNRRTRLLRYTQRIATARWRDWRELIASRLRRVTGQASAPAAAPVDFGLPDVDAAGFAAGLATLVERGTRIYLLYTGSILNRYNHASQFRDVMLDLPGQTAANRASLAKVRCDFVPEVDHTLTPLGAQRELIQRIDAWLQASAGGDPAGEVDRDRAVGR